MSADKIPTTESGGGVEQQKTERMIVVCLGDQGGNVSIWLCKCPMKNNATFPSSTLQQHLWNSDDVVSGESSSSLLESYDFNFRHEHLCRSTSKRAHWDVIVTQVQCMHTKTLCLKSILLVIYNTF